MFPCVLRFCPFQFGGVFSARAGISGLQVVSRNYSVVEKLGGKSSGSCSFANFRLLGGEVRSNKKSRPEIATGKP